LKNDEVTFHPLMIFSIQNPVRSHQLKKGETDVFVFYSGHGIPDKNGETTYLFPATAKLQI